MASPIVRSFHKSPLRRTPSPALVKQCLMDYKIADVTPVASSVSKPFAEAAMSTLKKTIVPSFLQRKFGAASLLPFGRRKDGSYAKSSQGFLSADSRSPRNPGNRSPGLNNSHVEFSATRDCRALVHSPFRQMSFKLQRRKLYRQSTKTKTAKRASLTSPPVTSPATATYTLSALQPAAEHSTPHDFDDKPIARSSSVCRFPFKPDDDDDTQWLSAAPTVVSPSSAPSSPAPVAPKIGKGGFGSVFIGSYNGVKVAIKQFHEQPGNERAKRSSFTAELNAFRLQHPHIVRIIAFTSLKNVTQVVYEYVGPRNLQQILDDDAEPIDFRRRHRYCAQVADALLFCHASNILHLDVKPANVLITEFGDNCKLADFGSSRSLLRKASAPPGFSPSHLLSTHRYQAASPYVSDEETRPTGTLIYQSPELLRGLRPTAKADVYSYALLVWQTVTRRSPFVEQTNGNVHATVFQVVRCGLRPECVCIEAALAGRERKLLELAKICWHSDPIRRPDFSQICARLRGELP